ncbi:MAG: nucleotidyltransferase family protein [Gammaproteobacteria bacterium]|nr:nucleotidyltransferase family protein [Gammaproteobacteria bacterium]MBP6479668.1 nucleotidyltransferase family protein [Pseudomonadales bacterium]MBP7910501.1 nucleotidyltransferase family protein [Pseudomonadales bacterium]
MSAAAAPLVVGGLLLAGGRGRRFGSDKRAALLPDGTTMLARSLGLLRACCDECVLVIGEEDHAAQFTARFPGVRILRSPRSRGGMGFTLADAIAQLMAWDACLVSLADKPFIRPGSMRRVRELLGAHDLVVPTHGGAWGHPVGFAHRHFHALTRLEGDMGARALIVAEQSRACFVELDDPGILADVDTPEQLDYLSGLLS